MYVWLYVCMYVYMYISSARFISIFRGSSTSTGDDDVNSSEQSQSKAYAVELSDPVEGGLRVEIGYST